VAGVDVRGCLHLKSAATMVDEERLLVNPEWVDVDDLATFELITIDPAEPFGANVLRIGDAIIASDAHPLTRRRLERHGFAVSTVDMSETAKAEGGVTCCSLLLRDLA